VHILETIYSFTITQKKQAHMIQKINNKKIALLLCMLYTITSPIVAARAGDLDRTFGSNGIVISKQLWNGQPSFSATGLILREGSYNDIVVSATRIIDPPTKQSVLVSYKQTNGSLNIGSFGENNRGFSNFINIDHYKAIASLRYAETDALIITGNTGSTINTTYPVLIQASATGIIANRSNITSPSLRGIFNALVVDQVNQYIFTAGNTIPNEFFRFTRFHFSNFTGSVIDNTTNYFPQASASHINSIALQSDKNILVAGQTTNAAIPQFTLARYQQNATIDTNFASSGRVVVFENESEAKAVTIQTIDGSERIVAAGWVKIDNKKKLALVRYDLDGRPDTSFGQTGKIIEDFDGDQVSAHALTIDNNNKIVVVGEFSLTTISAPIFIVARYNSDGTLDTDFGQEGWITTSPTSYGASLNAVAIDAHNNIVCAGYSINQNGLYEITLARYIGTLPTPGTLDTQFGNAGLTTTFITPTPLSKIFRGGRRPQRPSSNKKLLNSNNKLANNKLIIKNAENNSAIQGMTIRGYPYDDIIVVGITETMPISQTIASYDSIDGTLNAGYFGQPLSRGYNNYRGFTSNILANTINTANAGYAIAIQNNTGKIVTAGTLFNANYKKNTLTFFTFSPTGQDPYPFPRELPLWYGTFKAIAHPADPAAATTSFLYAGFLDQTTMLKRFLIGKFNYTRTNDNSFNNNLPVVTNFTDTLHDFSQINAMVVYPASANYKIAVAGSALIEGQNRFVLARYLSNGTLDTTFNGTGKVITDFFPITSVLNRDDTAYGIALQQIAEKTKIIVVGTTARQKGGYCLALARYNDNGTLDPGFGGTGTGIRVDCFGSSSDEARAVVIDEDNKIVLAGISADQINKFLVTRYTQHGNLDTTFGENGKVFTPFFGNGAGANTIALQNINGFPKIVVAGFAIDDDRYSRFALARYNA